MQILRCFGLRVHLVLLFFALGLWGCDGLFQDLDRIAYSGEPTVEGPDPGEGGPGDSGGGEKNGAEENEGRTNMNGGDSTDLNAGDSTNMNGGDSQNRYEEPPDEEEVDAGEFDSDVREEVDASGCMSNDDCYEGQTCGDDGECVDIEEGCGGRCEAHHVCRDGECVVENPDPEPGDNDGDNQPSSDQCTINDDCSPSQYCDEEGFCVDGP